MIVYFNNILAAGDSGDAINLLIIVVLIGISIVGGWLQKRAERKSEENQDAQVAQRRKRDSDLRESISRSRSQRKETVRTEAASRSKLPSQQARPETVIQPVLSRAKRPDAQAIPQARPPRERPPQITAAKSRLQQLTPEVIGHLAHPVCELKPEPPKAKLGQLSVQVAATDTTQASQMRNKVRLSRKGQARRAIIYHEIFSRPKALRTEREMWDM